ncbi:hypothetical protein COOONC_15792 [Cooperia oncophora]
MNAVLLVGLFCAFLFLCNASPISHDVVDVVSEDKRSQRIKRYGGFGRGFGGFGGGYPGYGGFGGGYPGSGGFGGGYPGSGGLVAAIQASAVDFLDLVAATAAVWGSAQA